MSKERSNSQQDRESKQKEDFTANDMFVESGIQNFERSYKQYENFLKKAFEKGQTPLPSQFASVESVKDFRAKEEKYDYDAHTYDYRSVCFSSVLKGDVDITKYNYEKDSVIVVSKDNINEFAVYNLTHLN